MSFINIFPPYAANLFLPHSGPNCTLYNRHHWNALALIIAQVGENSIDLISSRAAVSFLAFADKPESF